MDRRIYIGSAWPYVNGDLHLGHIAALVPADLLARYHRLVGDQVLWTSGSDCHGTPITQRARKEGCTPREIAQRYHDSVKKTFEQFGFSYSLYGATMEPWHHACVQESFLELHELSLIIEDDYHAAHCDACMDTRADREINGTCQKCNAVGARGDQCNACGSELNPSELLEPVCAICGGAIKFETSRELFLNLPAFAERLRVWVQTQTHWRDNAKKWTEGWLAQGLKPRAISRKIDWGIPIPLMGWDNRRIYVWFEAVHGYLTASMEWARQQGDPEAWKKFWIRGDGVTAYYVIGKDNIPFHTLMWSFILSARGLVLPWHIVSSEYLGLEGKPLSTSKNWAIWAPDYLLRHDPDRLRYFLFANGPEKQDVDFTWKGFVETTNSELVGNYSNLVHRVLSLVCAVCDGQVPESHKLQATDSELLLQCETTFNKVGVFIEATEFRRAIETVMQLVQAANRYMSHEQPWKLINIDRERAETVLHVAFQVLASLSVLTEPFMPFQAKRLRQMLSITDEGLFWEMPKLLSGHRLGQISPLFMRLDKSVIADEEARLRSQSTA
ncbi:methionine--tRNA ligase [Candidatus Falkowbacteria bacterium]|nr:methionine--tRNA ligase [Candidatus Falkowbacteria bacterium]